MITMKKKDMTVDMILGVANYHSLYGNTNEETMQIVDSIEKCINGYETVIYKGNIYIQAYVSELDITQIYLLVPARISDSEDYDYELLNISEYSDMNHYIPVAWYYANPDIYTTRRYLEEVIK